jgi:hypothetical protein
MGSTRTAAIAIVSTSLLLAAACGGGGGGDDVPGDDVPGDDTSNPNEAAYIRCVELTNELRATVGRPPVERSAELEAYATEGAEYDHGRDPHDHFRSNSGGGIAFAENECPHWDLSFGGGSVTSLVEACIDAFWSEGPGTGDAHGHYNNMIGNYGTLGCGIYNEGSDYTIIQDYGR